MLASIRLAEAKKKGGGGFVFTLLAFGDLRILQLVDHVTPLPKIISESDIVELFTLSELMFITFYRH